MLTMNYSTIFCILLVFSLIGCGKKDHVSVPVSPATSSNEALMRALEAMKKRDADSLLSLVSGGDEPQALLASVIETFEVVDVFKEKFIDAYGDQAWLEFLAPPEEGQTRPDMSLVIPDFEKLITSSTNWEANDDNQGRFETLSNLSLPFKEKGGGWIIDGDSIYPDEDTLIKYTETQKVLIEFIESYSHAIGKEGISPEDIDYQMGKDLMITLLGGEFIVDGKSANPDRFKLDEL